MCQGLKIYSLLVSITQQLYVKISLHLGEIGNLNNRLLEFIYCLQESPCLNHQQASIFDNSIFFIKRVKSKLQGIKFNHLILVTILFLGTFIDYHQEYHVSFLVCISLIFQMKIWAKIALLALKVVLCIYGNANSRGILLI